MFDPTTHIATEENFIKLLEHEVYDRKYIGYGVTLSNSVDYNNGVWIIADVDHDSANTGQTNCYDLISRDTFHSTKYSSGEKMPWTSSTIKNWLNNTFYNAFSSDIKYHILNIKYKSQTSWRTAEKVILPSLVEVYGTITGYDTEGVTYPIFTDDTSRKKYDSEVTTYHISKSWWTRTRYKTNNSNFEYVNTAGSIDYVGYSGKNELAPLFRIQ